jgi:hypothetical protein
MKVVLTEAASLVQSAVWALLEVGRNSRERVIKLSAKLNDGGDDCNRNTRGNQTVFNGGSTGLVFQESDDLRHFVYNSTPFWRVAPPEYCSEISKVPCLGTL